MFSDEQGKSERNQISGSWSRSPPARLQQQNVSVALLIAVAAANLRDCPMVVG
jgi:hypothetical protein